MPGLILIVCIALLYYNPSGVASSERGLTILLGAHPAAP